MSATAIATETCAVPLAPAPLRRQSWPVLASLALLGALTAALVALLWPHWVQNPELSHAFVTPFVFVWLLHEARAGTPRYVAPTAGTAALVAGLVAAALLVLGASGLYAAVLDWSHSLVAFTLSIALALVWAAGLCVFADRRHRLLPLNWSSAVALLFWVLSAPLPPGTYSRLTIGLQLFVTENVLRALHLLGIAATRHGNVIELATTRVGVEDACSGVRSLVSCVFAAFLFSATLVRSTWARAVLIVLAVPLAIGMNFVRSLLLTLLANGGTNIAGTWHDVTGYAVLAVTAALLAGLALALARITDRQRGAAPTSTLAPGTAATAGAGERGATVRAGALLAGLAAAALLIGFFVIETRPSVRKDTPVPNLMAVLPATVPGWRVETSRDLYQFGATLHTDHLAQRTYLRGTDTGVLQITVYLAYWQAGQAPASLVASHTPDACWPGSGWTPVTTEAPRQRLEVAGRALPDTEARVFRSDDFPQYVWFWHLYDGRPIAYRDPYSARELLRSAWQYGFSHDGDQLFVRVSSNQPWSVIGGEPLVGEVFARLRPLGLERRD